MRKRTGQVAVKHLNRQLRHSRKMYSQKDQNSNLLFQNKFKDIKKMI